MSATNALIGALVMAGMDIVDAAGMVARAGAEMAAGPTKGALRTRKWRATQASQTVTGDATNEPSQTVTNRHKPSQCDVSPNPPISTSNNSKESKRQNRGTRIAPDWAPSDAERSFARQEGFSDFEISREINKFRDYWTACAGAKGVKLDWAATWRQWIRSGAERAGKAPTSGPNVANLNSFYAAADSEQLAAWDSYSLRTAGKGMPRDRNQGWRVKAEWPPEHDVAPAPPSHEAAAE